MANPLRGEADIAIGGKVITVKVHLAALMAIAQAVGAKTMSDIAGAVFQIENMPKVLKAVLDTNGVKDVSQADIDAWDYGEFLGPLLDALLRREPKKATDEDPPKGQTATS